MTHKTFRITGRVIDQTGQGVEGLRIKAWDKDLFFDDLVGSAETGSEGFFEMEFEESYFKEIFARRPDLYFKIFRQDELIPGAEFEVEVQLPTGKIRKGSGDKVFCKVASGTTNVTIKLQIPAASQLFKVKGTILQPDGTPVTGAVVKAVDKDLRHEEELGEATTSQSGRYEITYTPQQFYRAEKKSADLIVQVFDKDDPGLILAASSILFNAPAVATIDLKVESQLSEFERLFNELAPLLKIDNVALADLSEEDIVFLAGETGFEKKWLQTLADAARITAEADLELDLSVNDITAIFYGLGRKGQPLILNELLGQDFFVLRRMLEDALDANIIPHYLSASLDAFFAELDRLVSESGLDKPVSHIAVQQKNLQHIGEFVGLDSAKITRLIAKAVTFAGINDTTLRSLVEAEELQENEAKQVGLAVSLYHLFDADMMLMEAVKSGTFPQLPQGSVIDIKDLVAFDTADWLDILQAQEDITLPDDLTTEEYAALLSKKIEKLYPSDTLLARLIRTDEDAIKKHIGILKPIFDKNETVFGVGSSKKLTIEKSKPEETEKQGNAHSALSRLVNQYKGLNLAEILDNRELSAEDNAAQLSERIGLLSRFQSQNPDAEVLALDYAPESEDVAALDFNSFTTEEEQMVLSCFKSCQRTYAVTEDVEHCQALMTAGYDSALKIVNDSQENFQTHSGLSAGISHDIYEASLETAGTTATLVGSIIDVVQGGFDWTDVSNQSPSTVDYLKKIEGFEELFGNQDYCKCQHCQSLLSPAAYFVDLMSFVEKNISAINFSDDQQDHVLNLKRRRRDLWELQLTCENTHGLIPYLDIINEVLENYIYVSGHGGNEEALPARSVIESYVYEQKISQSVHSFQLPKLLPLQKLETYLSHFDVTRGEIAKLLEQDSYIVAAAVLKLSGKEFELITQSNQNLNFLKRLYGIDFKIDPESGCIKKFDAQELLSPMGLSRTELGELIKTHYVTTSSQETIQIKGEKKYVESVQEDIERIVGLTPLSLDRMHRFVRLWRQLSWSISELDLVLSHLNEEDLSTGIDEDTLLHLVTLLELQNRFAISVEEMCALWTSIPQEVISAQEESLFDRLFNLAEFVSLDGNYPKSSTLFTHPAFEGDNNGENNDLHRLLAGLRVNDEQLYQLIFHLSDPLGLNLEPDEGEEYKPDFALSVDNLSLLYRHARLVQRLNVTIPQLFQLTEQEQSVGSGSINGLNDMSTFLDHYDWWRSTGYSIDDISYILGSQIINSDAYPNAKDLATQILVEIHKDGALTFADTVFAYLDNVTEEQSKIIIETNSGWIKNVPDSTLYWLTSSFDSITLADDPRAGLTFLTSIFSHLKGISSEQSELIVDANPGLIEKVEIQNPHGKTITVCRLSEDFKPNSTLTIPAGITIDEAEAKKLLLAYYNAEEGVYPLLMAYHITEVIPLYLARHFDFTVDKIKSLIAMTGVDLAAPEFVTAVQSTESVADEIIDFVEELLRLSTLFRGKFFDADALDFVNQEKQEVFGIDDLNALLIQNIRKISLYADFISGIEGHSSLDDLQDVLRNAADNATLARVLNAEPSLIITLLEHLSLPSTPLEAFDKLRNCIEMVKYLGVGGQALSLVVSENYDVLTRAGDAILGAFRAKYDDEKEWNEKIAPYEEKIRTLKRDMLTDYLVHSEDYPWCTCDKDLYYYFLLDVELEGCARTSRVVAAISSVQLYVHRVLMNLEQSEAGDIHVTPQNPKEFIKEWKWRKNYRVWEANRKVFLYPENWIEPELRDNKTPLFEALESELLQQEINEQTVLDAYANYMRGFEELAHLKIAGSYHEKDDKNKTDTLHLFGVTSDEPPIYYYRAIENAHYGEREKDRGVVWSPWRKIDVQIPVNKVSPIIFRGRLHVFWVEFTTRPKNEVKDGGSEFVGYQHKMSLKYTNLRLDGTWTTPQRISLYGVHPFDNGDGIINDPLICGGFEEIEFDGTTMTVYVGTRPTHEMAPIGKEHDEPEEGYTLSGYRWDQIYPTVYLDDEGVEQLVITGRDWELIAAPIDFYKRTANVGRNNLFLVINRSSNQNYGPNYGTHFLMNSGIESDQRKIKFFMAGIYYQVDYAYASIFIDNDRVQSIKSKYSSLGTNIDILLQEGSILEIGRAHKESQLSVVNGSIQDVIIDLSGDLFLLSNKPQMCRYWLKRLGTTLSEKVARALLIRGVDGLLDIDTQKILIENPSPITKAGYHVDDSYVYYIDDSYIENAISAEKPDFKGAFGTYYREIFFHIPFLIANHLNSQQKFPEAQKWYHYIFDPTANEEIDIFGSGSTPTPEEALKKQRDSKWRYIEFRNIDIDTLRDKLTNNDEAIEVYRKDPFNPHAIARLRLSAYQKTIVMKYIDNLLDWGDQLFSQDTMESINEASLLYILASDILGERPAELGECSEIPVASRNYESIKEVLDEDSPFLIEMEYFTVTGHRFNYASPAKASQYTLDPVTANHATQNAYASLATALSPANQPAAAMHSVDTAALIISEGESAATEAAWDVGLSMAMDWSQASAQMHPQYYPRGWLEFASQISPVFCVPENKGLKQYWDRVEDRLYKIRNCMNISGVRRELSLFAPEIDPGLLVRAKAAGLSVEDVLNAISGNLPPYRFSYIIEKAKSYAGAVQGFGAALLSALEKKDVEELTLLRTVHEQNIMKMTKQVKQWEIDAANENIEALKRRKETVQHRRDYYHSLIDEGRTPWEVTQAVAQHGAAGLRGLAASFNTYGAIAYLVPQVGSPFAMKYGGKEQGDSGSSWSEVFRALAEISDTVATSAGFEANLERRDQGWAHQLEQAEHELKELEKQIKGAEIHKDMTKRSLELHEKSLEQLNEVYEFYGDKFSNLGLYTWLSTTLQRLYREAYNSAYSMAKLVEQTYRFERSDDTSELLSSGHWDAPKAGLLAGECLSIDLQNLERKFIETNYRSLEVNQSFSLSQIAPTVLIQLKETGECEFEIAEIFFDFFYPGHYRRKIKSARLTIPCVTGPYTNVSATLTLVGSSIRVEPVVEDELRPVPRTRTLSIATSSAQNDAGVFELNFRDERYMPFEGAGAISSWKLSLPKNYRQFDYQTISDVLIHVSYTAEEDGVLREKIEGINAMTEGSIQDFLTEHSLPRVFSFRHDFSNEFHRLLHSPIDKSVMIELTDKHFPIFLKGKSIQVKKAMFILGTSKDQSITDFEISINGASHTAADFTRYAQYGDLWSKDLDSPFSGGVLGEHTFIIKDAGDLVPDSPAPSDPSAIDSKKLTDIYLYLEYGIN